MMAKGSTIRELAVALLEISAGMLGVLGNTPDEVAAMARAATHDGQAGARLAATGKALQDMAKGSESEPS